MCVITFSLDKTNLCVFSSACQSFHRIRSDCPITNRLKMFECLRLCNKSRYNYICFGIIFGWRMKKQFPNRLKLSWLIHSNRKPCVICFRRSVNVFKFDRGNGEKTHRTNIMSTSSVRNDTQMNCLTIVRWKCTNPTQTPLIRSCDRWSPKYLSQCVRDVFFVVVVYLFSKVW